MSQASMIWVVLQIDMGAGIIFHMHIITLFLCSWSLYCNNC